MACIATSLIGVLMPDEKKTAYLTRGGLYFILGNIYLLIAFVLLGLARLDQNDRFVQADFIMLGVALGLSLTFSILGIREQIRERRRRTRESGDRAD
jgi:hypothetical protein